MGSCFVPVVAGDKIGPEITVSKAGGDECVLPADEIRRLHPGLLKHDRNSTMREGIRTLSDGGHLKGSLKACINCHAIKEDGKYINTSNPNHFCTSCHVYAGVSFDCFQCHRDTPEK
ncbi:MAG: Hdr-like menaquinol oxidoreductase cytochrome c subunit [Gammaproteobacteria bacterium]|nr:Hdr-like menaquinol oxidoreductase cytochrome c subunit [Gammaproteobacteria bacterium]